MTRWLLIALAMALLPPTVALAQDGGEEAGSEEPAESDDEGGEEGGEGFRLADPWGDEEGDEQHLVAKSEEIGYGIAIEEGAWVSTDVRNRILITAGEEQMKSLLANGGKTSTPRPGACTWHRVPTTWSGSPMVTMGPRRWPRPSSPMNRPTSIPSCNGATSC